MAPNQQEPANENETPLAALWKIIQNRECI